MSGSEATERDSTDLRAKAGTVGASVEAGLRVEAAQKETEEIEERYKRSKIDFLHRHIIEYQDLFRRLGQLSEGDAYLFLDDFYHIRRLTSPKL